MNSPLTKLKNTPLSPISPCCTIQPWPLLVRSHDITGPAWLHATHCTILTPYRGGSLHIKPLTESRDTLTHCFTGHVIIFRIPTGLLDPYQVPGSFSNWQVDLLDLRIDIVTHSQYLKLYCTDTDKRPVRVLVLHRQDSCKYWIVNKT